MDDAKPLTLYEKETLFFQDTDCLLKICRHVSSGGSVIDLADLHGIRYCDIMAFIRSSKSSSDLYDKALLDRNEWAKESILNQLKRVATFDIRELYDETGNLKPVHMWPDSAASVVAGVDVFDEFEGVGKDRVKVGEVRKVKLFDKLKALELKGKTQSLFTDRVERTTTLKLEDLVLASYKDEKEKP